MFNLKIEKQNLGWNYFISLSLPLSLCVCLSLSIAHSVYLFISLSIYLFISLSPIPFLRSHSLWSALLNFFAILFVAKTIVHDKPLM